MKTAADDKFCDMFYDIQGKQYLTFCVGRITRKYMHQALFGPKPSTANIFCPESAACFLHQLHIIQMHFRLLLIMDANTVNSDQTAPKF